MSIYSRSAEALSSEACRLGGNSVGVDLAGFPPHPRTAAEVEGADQRKGSRAACHSSAVGAGGSGDRRGRYPELHGTTSHENCKSPRIGPLEKCGKWGKVGNCPSGHRFARPLRCGLEWCPDCGLVDSDVHKQRRAAWIPKVMTADSWLYLVFTVPPELRANYRTKKALGALGVAIKRLLQRAGYSRGLRRMHFFGDRSPVYHPHLNVLVPGEWMSPAVLLQIKRSYARILGCPVSRVNVRVAVRRGPGQILHAVRYITRATFKRREWDLELGRRLLGFRNSGSWGNWSSVPAVWSMEKGKGEVTKALNARLLEQGVCPDCGGPVTWTGVERWHQGALWHETGGGYYKMRGVEHGRAWQNAA